MGWIKRAIERQIDRTQLIEIEAFIANLSCHDETEIALTLVVVTDTRNRLDKIGYSLLFPETSLTSHPFVCLEIGRQVNALRKKNNNIAADGLEVWLHTLRAIQSATLLPSGRRMWKELMRGLPCLDDATDMFLSLSGRNPELNAIQTIPYGIFPDHTYDCK